MDWNLITCKNISGWLDDSWVKVIELWPHLGWCWIGQPLSNALIPPLPNNHSLINWIFNIHSTSSNMACISFLSTIITSTLFPSSAFLLLLHFFLFFSSFFFFRFWLVRLCLHLSSSSLLCVLVCVRFCLHFWLVFIYVLLRSFLLPFQWGVQARTRECNEERERESGNAIERESENKKWDDHLKIHFKRSDMAREWEVRSCCYCEAQERETRILSSHKSSSEFGVNLVTSPGDASRRPFLNWF